MNKQNLSNALIKLERSLETGVDPISGFTTKDILEWIEEHEPLDPITSDEWSKIAKASIRRLIAKSEQISLRNRQIRDLRRELRK